MGIYIFPTDTMGVEDIWAAWEACTEGCIPLFLGDLNINFNEPRDKHEEVIRDLLDNINLVDTSRRFTPRRPSKQLTRARWTWRHKREGRMHYSQPDYSFACKKGHQAVSERRVLVATISRLGPPSRHRDHTHREEATEGLPAETARIPTASTPHRAAG